MAAPADNVSTPLPVQIETLKTWSEFRPMANGPRANNCQNEGTFPL
jgi:hypothetical protein